MQPSDFYFKICDDWEGMTIYGFTVVITSKKVWDEEGRWDDSGEIFDYDIIPAGFEELTECVFEYSSIISARNILLNAGFIENNDL